MPGEVDHIAKAVEAVAEAAVADAVAMVKAHPDYVHLTEQLAARALTALATGL